ncbi:MAG: hypothetical protein ACREKM_08255, partial [Longimicrobiales bacterium]
SGAPVSDMAPPPVGAARATAAGARGRPAPMIGPGMAAAKAPPFRLPAEHFTAAMIFLLLGVSGTIVIAPDLASGAFVSQRVAGVTHLFTLGWITTSIMGALYQFLPVALGEPIRSVRVAHTSFGLYVPGLAAFVGGLIAGQHVVMLFGAATFGTGVLLFIGNLSATLRASTRRDVTWWALACATFFLLVTLVFGGALAGNLRWGYLGAGRLNALGVHLHVALAGWVLLVMIGVAHRLLPMFLLSHGAGDRAARVAVACVASGAGVLAVLHHAASPISRWLPAALIAVGCGAFLVQAHAFYVHRHRPALDPGMRLAGAALGVIGIALVLAWPVVLTDAHARITTAYIAAALLGISLFVAAHYYKIVPFLVWYHRFGPLAGKQPVPRVGELYSARIASLAGVLLVMGALTLIAAIALGVVWPARAGALLLAAGVGIEALQMLQLARKQP